MSIKPTRKPCFPRVWAPLKTAFKRPWEATWGRLESNLVHVGKIWIKLFPFDASLRPHVAAGWSILARARGGQGGQGSGQGGPGGQRERGWDPLGPPEEKVFDMFENSQKPSGQHELC